MVGISSSTFFSSGRKMLVAAMERLAGTGFNDKAFSRIAHTFPILRPLSFFAALRKDCNAFFCSFSLLTCGTASFCSEGVRNKFERPAMACVWDSSSSIKNILAAESLASVPKCRRMVTNPSIICLLQLTLKRRTLAAICITTLSAVRQTSLFSWSKCMFNNFIPLSPAWSPSLEMIINPCTCNSTEAPQTVSICSTPSNDVKTSVLRSLITSLHIGHRSRKYIESCKTSSAKATLGS
mmetsp:Transcript_74225/g.135543  ORF Transcript_74225/g.135543 Transcript_74225/m.135543 type:complete len:238 (-) Transcript_74225:385-1098(-)